MATLLVADADHLMRWSLDKFLSRQGHTVVTVASDKAAVEAAGAGRYHVAILDYLSAADAFRSVQSIKQQSPTTHVIVLAAEPTRWMIRTARDAGAFDFFEKPFDLSCLADAVARAATAPERRRGPRGCCPGCEWQRPCVHWTR
jgi:DNA-binding NtrC family response regulator